MDSVNYTETQNTQISCRNTGSNTNPIACACCGSKEYVQTVPQANCFRAFYPGPPRCTHPSDNCEDNFVMQQPMFSSPPFLPPLLHNGPVPSNLYCFHNNMSDAISLHHRQTTSEIEKLLRQSSLFSGLLFSHKEKTDCAATKTTLDKNVNKDSENESGKAQNLAETQINPCVQRCPCTDSSPWICSPFVMPLISYCVLWNSQRPNPNYVPSGYSCKNQTENPGRTQVENEANRVDISTERFKNDRGKEDTSAGNPDQPQDYQWADDKSRKRWRSSQNNGSSTSFLTLNSLSYPEDNTTESEVKKVESNLTLKNDSEYTEEANNETEIEDDTSIDRLENYECIQLDQHSEADQENVLPVSNNSSEIDLRDDDDDNNNNNNINDQLLPSSEMISDLKEEKSYANEEILPPDYGALDTTETPKLHPSEPLGSSTETVEEEEFIKKEFYAGAGDLGGETCTGFRISISPPRRDIPQVQPEENLKPDEKPTEEKSNTSFVLKKSDVSPEKDTETKSPRRFKSGIAKLSNNYRIKETVPKIPKDKIKVPPPQKGKIESVKRKHNCLLSENSTGSSETNSKIQKAKTSSTTQEQISEKQNRSREPIVRPLEGRKKFSTNSSAAQQLNCKK